MYARGAGKLSGGQIAALVPKIRVCVIVRRLRSFSKVHIYQEHGGEICEKEADADTIIARHEGIDGLKEFWWDSKTIYVCAPPFVQLCINNRQYIENLEGPRRNGMGGCLVGSRSV